jgi:hypothetical protein
VPAFSPKNLGPDQCAPVIRSAMAERAAKRSPANTKPASVTSTVQVRPCHSRISRMLGCNRAPTDAAEDRPATMRCRSAMPRALPPPERNALHLEGQRAAKERKRTDAYGAKEVKCCHEEFIRMHQGT